MSFPRSLKSTLLKILSPLHCPNKVDELSKEDEQINIPYYVGEPVKVTDGPFNGFDMLLINEEKLQVMVKTAEEIL